MTTIVEKLAETVKALPDQEFDEFLLWLADYGLARSDRWDQEIERDSQAGGRLDAVLRRVRRDIAARSLKPLDEIINHP